MKTKFNQPYLRVALIGVFALISALIPNCVFAQKYHSHILTRGDTFNAGLQFLQLNGNITLTNSTDAILIFLVVTV
ncbi:MAG: hypothetical protein IPH94_13765 [Saprospiraceae bacterium]|nr:hypothetical protein [Saprospiraceae bacterium]